MESCTSASKSIAGTKLARLLLAGLLAGCVALIAEARPTAQAQTSVQPVQPQVAPPKKSAAPSQGATKKPAPVARQFDRTLLRPALLKEKAPDTYQVKFTTTRGDFVVTV